MDRAHCSGVFSSVRRRGSSWGPTTHLLLLHALCCAIADWGHLGWHAALFPAFEQPSASLGRLQQGARRRQRHERQKCREAVGTDGSSGRAFALICVF